MLEGGVSRERITHSVPSFRLSTSHGLPTLPLLTKRRNEEIEPPKNKCMPLILGRPTDIMWRELGKHKKHHWDSADVFDWLLTFYPQNPDLLPYGCSVYTMKRTGFALAQHAIYIPDGEDDLGTYPRLYDAVRECGLSATRSSRIRPCMMALLLEIGANADSLGAAWDGEFRYPGTSPLIFARGNNLTILELLVQYRASRYFGSESRDPNREVFSSKYDAREAGEEGWELKWAAKEVEKTRDWKEYVRYCGKDFGYKPSLSYKEFVNYAVAQGRPHRTCLASRPPAKSPLSSITRQWIYEKSNYVLHYNLLIESPLWPP